MAATREKPKLPVNYQEQLAAESAQIAKRIAAPSGDRIRMSGNSKFILPDGSEGEEFEAVIVEFGSSNLFYEGAFDRDNPQPPSCFAIGPEPSLLVPSPNSPAKKAESCAVCPNNQFGSSGKGKACKNTRLLALVPVGALEEDGDVPIWIMSVPPTSLKAFDSYAQSLASKYKTTTLGVVTKITLDPSTTYASPRFSVVRPLKGEEFNVFVPRREEAATRLSAEPDVSQYVAPKTNGRGVPLVRGRR